MINWQTVVATVIILLVIWGLWQLHKLSLRRNIEKAMQQGRAVGQRAGQMNFDADIAFLMFILENKISYAMKYIIEPMEITHEKAYLNNATADTITEGIVEEIMPMLSEQYKTVLYKYFTSQSLDEFIIETVYKAVVNGIRGLNGKKIRAGRSL
jgi:hypothetical protein